ncbi:MAG: chemotaxis protein CheW [Acidobacteriota bacterium]|nr:chemotaxis protein CheW [Acidobacteriota bacterium]
MAEPDNKAPQSEAVVPPEEELVASPAEDANGEAAQPEEQYCIFRAGRERYCLGVLEVDEVVEWPRMTRLPLAPPFLMGVFNLRGTIVPVIDIAFTEVRRGDLPPRQVVVACQRGSNEAADVRLGLAVDEVVGTYSTSEPLLKEEAPREVPHCAGMLRHGERLALALDLKKVLETFPVGVI